MSGGEARQAEILTFKKLQHLGIPGCGRDGHSILPRAGDGEILRAHNDQFLAVISLIPCAVSTVCGIVCFGA